VAAATGSGTTSPVATTTVATSATGDGSSTAPSTRPPDRTSPCGRSAPAPPTYAHVVWIWMENHRRTDVIGDPAAPYTTALAHRCGSADRYASVGSPSLPNYLGATSGGTQGVSDDRSPTSHPVTADNLFRQVRAAGGRAVSYEEGMATPCSLRSQASYAVKHNPAAYFSSVEDRAACLRDDLPLGDPDAGALADDLAGATLPTFAFVTPDLCHDTHNCGVEVGDRWLAIWVPRLLDSAPYRSGATAVFIVWDEPTPMPFIAIAPTVSPGSAVSMPVDHYSLLRTTEELLGLRPYLGGASTAPSMRASLGL
jgi:hypothetical protein